MFCPEPLAARFREASTKDTARKKAARARDFEGRLSCPHVTELLESLGWCGRWYMACINRLSGVAVLEVCCLERCTPATTFTRMD